MRPFPMNSFYALILLSACPGIAGAQNLKSVNPHRLTCEYLINPLGIDESAPRLSWQLPLGIEAQTAYHLLVSTDESLLKIDKANIWDSGKVESDQSIHIVYSGPRLRSGVRYYWKVRVWNLDNRATDYSSIAYWQMGLLNDSDWKARWIAYPRELPGNIHAHIGYQSQVESTPDCLKWLQIDLGESKNIDAIKIYPAEAFRHIKKKGFLYPVRFRIDLSDDSEFKSYKIVYALEKDDIPNPGGEPQVYQFPVTQARYARLTVTRLCHRDKENYGFALAEMEILNQGKIISRGKSASALDSQENDGVSIEYVTDGITECYEAQYPPPSPSPMFRKEFSLPSKVERATLYATALGLYEIYINERRVGENILAPEWTDYTKRIQYQAYDVTDMLDASQNAIGAILGEGWYAGLVGLVGPRQYGSRLGLLLQLQIQCEDGTAHTIVSDESWRGTVEGPIRASDIIRGETYDARKELTGWAAPGFDENAWDVAQTLPSPQAKLVAQTNEPIKITQEIDPISITEPQPGAYVFDMGQNMVGWARIKLRCQKGRQIRLRHAEVLNPDGSIYTKNLRDNNRRDPIKEYQANYYICGGENEEIYEPHFTYHGFRYLEVTGLTYKPVIADVVGCVFHSAAPLSGTFECSDPMLNRLMKNISWTQRGNMHSTPTDCPQRDERLGWMGDAQLFSQAACFNMNMAAFFTKWCQDIRDAQAADGRFSDFSPNPVLQKGQFLASPAWADAGVIVPWRVYINYGDKRILERHYESAKRWVEYVHQQSEDSIWTKGRGNDYGDWLNGDTLILEGWPKKGADTPREIFATAFFAYSTEIVSKMAAIIGRSEDAAHYLELANTVKNSFVKHYVKSDGEIASDTQSVYALALHFNLLPEDLRPVAMKHLLRKIEEYDNRASTGIQATNRMMLELANEGHTDLAYALLMNRTVPSWGYTIDNGATTIWERWDGWVDGRGFQNPGMNSFNHYAIGAVGEWMYRNIVGINPDPSAPGYKHFILRPRPGGSLTYAKGEFDGLYGKIVSSWRIEDGRFILECAIPPNTTATLYLPSTDLRSLTEEHGNNPKIPKIEEGSVYFSVDPGYYRFGINYRQK